MTTHERLIAARAYVAAGWCQGQGSVGRAGFTYYCMIGGVGQALRDEFSLDTSVRKEALKQALILLASANGLSVYEIAHWNDMQGRTKGEVIAAFDRAIEATAPEPPLTVPAEWTAEPVAVA